MATKEEHNVEELLHRRCVLLSISGQLSATYSWEAKYRITTLPHEHDVCPDELGSLQKSFYHSYLDLLLIRKNCLHPGNLPGKPVAYNWGLLCQIYGLLWGIVACYFGLLGFPGRF